MRSTHAGSGCILLARAATGARERADGGAAAGNAGDPGEAGDPDEAGA